MPCFVTGLTNFNSRKYLLVHVYNGCGWHFLDWSIQYLSGQTQYYLFDDRKFVDLVSNPVDKKNAHAHQRVCVSSVDQLHDIDQQFNTLSDPDSIVVLQNDINFHTLEHNGVKLNSKDLTVVQREEHYQRVLDAIIELSQQAHKLGYKLISLEWSPEHQYIPMYQIRQGRAYDTGEEIDASQAPESWINTFFPESSNYFGHSIWDQRELLALTMRMPNSEESILSKICQQVPEITTYSTADFWFNAGPIFDGSDPERFKLWHEVYTQWQKLHDVGLSADYEEILDCIVSGKSKDLTVYNLNLLKEAFIQHGLIFKYNLNLKTWNLTKFPNNTLDLHKLLEENIHTL